MDNNIALVKHLKWTSEIELNNLKGIVPYSAAKNWTNIYFCCWLGEKLSRRCKDWDIKTKKYFCVDLDIRLDHFKQTWHILSQVEMLNESRKILQKINGSEFEDYSAVVDSWNGIHIYYTWVERAFDVREYAEWVSYIFEEIDEVIKETWYKCDPAVSNIARIMRLPWTINKRKKIQKDKITKEDVLLFDLWDYQCNVLFLEERDSKAFAQIEEKAKAYNEEKAIDKKQQIEVRQIIKKDYNQKTSDVRAEINAIPAWEVACDIRWVTLVDRWLDNVALKETKKNMWAYWYKPHNVIVNTWSSLISTQKSYFTTYELVYYEMMWWDKRKTIDYFKSRYWIRFEEKEKLEIPRKDFARRWYVYWSDVFEVFDCVMSWELVTIVAESNSWKTTFAMDMITRNANLWKKCFYINLEFPIETMRESRWLEFNWKRKRNLTDIEPLTKEECIRKDKYVKEKLDQFDYYNNPDGMELEELSKLIIEKEEQGIWFFVIDTFSRIKGNLVSEKARTSQNNSMEKLQELCQNLWVTIILLHHTNKKKEFEWSQKIMDLSNVFIMITKEDDWFGGTITKYSLSKDKYISSKDVECRWIKNRLIPANDDEEVKDDSSIFSDETKF